MYTLYRSRRSDLDDMFMRHKTNTSNRAFRYQVALLLTLLPIYYATPTHVIDPYLGPLLVGYALTVWYKWRTIGKLQKEVDVFTTAYEQGDWDTLLDYVVRGAPYDTLMEWLIFAYAPDRVVASYWELMTCDSPSRRTYEKLARNLYAFRGDQKASMLSMVHYWIPELDQYLSGGTLARIDEVTYGSN